MYFHPNFSGDPRTPIVTDSETQQGGRTGQVEEGSLGTILSVLLWVSSFFFVLAMTNPVIKAQHSSLFPLRISPTAVRYPHIPTFSLNIDSLALLVISTYHEACAALKISRFFVGVVILPLLVCLCIFIQQI